MSQTLCIGETPNLWYDCIITSKRGAKTKLRRKWFRLTGQHMKIRIRNKKLFRKLLPTIREVYDEFQYAFLDNTTFYLDDEDFYCLRERRFEKWLKDNGI